MTSQRIAAVVTLAVGIALGIALDRSARDIVRPLAAKSTAGPAQAAPDPALTQDEAMIIRVPRSTLSGS